MSDSQFVFEATDSNFDSEVVNHNGPVVVDFWAEWCGPCKALAPVIEELAEEFKDRVKVVKVNVDESPSTPQKFSIRGIPTLVMFNKNGDVANQLVGNQPKDSIKNAFEELIG